MDMKLVYGIHAVKTIIQQAPHRIRQLFTFENRRDQRLQEILQIASAAGIQYQLTSKAKLDELARSTHHQGLVAVLSSEMNCNESDLIDFVEKLAEPALLLVLDGIQDPHNLGACLRSANAAGVHAVIAPKDRAVALTPVVRKVASGAAELTPFIQVTNLARTLRELKEIGIWVYGAAGEADKSIYQVDMKGPTAIVMGAEGEGLRRLTRELCDELIKIPMIGTVESLNVSVATGVCLYESIRQRTHQK